MYNSKIGDQIKCINNHYTELHLTLNKIYIVLTTSDGFIQVLTDLGSTRYFSPSRFKLVKEKKIIKPFGIVTFCKTMYK